MRTYKITGGPSPLSVKVVDPDGKDISATVISLDFHYQYGELAYANIKVLAEVDAEILEKKND